MAGSATSGRAASAPARSTPSTSWPPSARSSSTRSAPGRSGGPRTFRGEALRRIWPVVATALDELAALRGMVDDWAGFLAVTPHERELEALRRHEQTSPPLGAGGFVTELEQRLGRRLRRGEPGRRGREVTEAD